MPIKARPVSAARAAAFAQGQFVFANNDIKNTMIKNLSMGAKANSCAKQGFMTGKDKIECNKFTCVYAHDDDNADTVSSSSSTSSAANTYLQDDTKERCLSYVTNSKEEAECDKFTSSLHYHEKSNKQVNLHTFLTEQANIIQEEKPATPSAAEISGVDDHKTSNTNANTECENTELGIKTGTNTNIICTDVCAEEFNNSTLYSSKLEQTEQHSEERKECNYSKLVHSQMEDNIFEQSIMQNKCAKNSNETEFDRLMSLLAIDVTRERQECESLLSHSPSMLHEEYEEHEHLRECIENTNTNVYINNKLNEEGISVRDRCNNRNAIASCAINDGSGHSVHDLNVRDSNSNEKSENVSKSYVLEIHANINAALESLYNTWENDMCDGQEGNNKCSRPFIATEHYGEAYLMSSNLHSNTINTNNNNNHNTNSLSSYSEAQNNLARKKETENINGNVFKNNVQSMYSNKWIDCYNATCANHVASEAQDRLDRFLLSIHIIERVVHDVVFIRLVANYLHSHRHVFIHHYNHAGSKRSDVEEKIINNDVVNEHEKIDSIDVMHRMSCDNCVEEHTHDEYAIFNVFSETVSDMLMSVLTTHVANFDESEFVEELYSTPIFFASSFEDNKRDNATLARKATSPSHVLFHDDNNNSSNNNNNNNNCEYDESWNNSDSVAQNATCGMNVLSYPAWRVIMAMSDFSSFFDWVMDFLAEEFSVVTTGENGTNVIVGGGHGIRALLNSTYTKRKHEQSKTNDMWTKQEVSELVHNEETQQQFLEPCKEQILQVKCNEEANQITTDNMTAEKVLENYKNESRKITPEEYARKGADSGNYTTDLSDISVNSCNTRKLIKDVNVKESHPCSSQLFPTNMNSINNNLPINKITSSSFTSVAPPTTPLSAKSQTSLRLRQLVRSKQQEFLHIKQQQQEQYNTTTSQQHREQEKQRRPRCLPPLKEESTGCSSLSQFSATAPVRSSSKTKYNETNTSSDSNININSSNNDNTNTNAYTHKKVNNVHDAVLSNNKTNSRVKDRSNKNKAAVNKLGNHMTSNQHNC